ncbi:MAG: hypothetical protein J6N21_02805 [Butyrivibrio sp.]|nr:hypothetical protein [Butyrivibrio sp.]
MDKFISLKGNWKVVLPDESEYSAALPGTLDTNEIGYEDKPVGKLYQDENYVENEALSEAKVIATRYTRKHTFEGKAEFIKVWDKQVPEDKRLFLKAERARVLYLFIDGKEVTALSGSISTPYVFEVTDLLHKGAEIKIVSDNSYENLPHDNIVYSSAATDETQTNWNGILGEFGIEIKEKAFIENVRVYPRRSENSASWILDVEAKIDSLADFEGKLFLDFEEISQKKEIEVEGKAGKTSIKASVLVDVPEELLWDEFHGKLIHLNCTFMILNGMSGEEDTCGVSFGIRAFEDIDGHLCINGRRVFLRSEANCAVFPETGHPPVDVEAWKKIIATYMGYGVNCLRFHSHCPPEAAFYAADELGVLMQPELSHWNPVDAFSDEKAVSYYSKELKEILNVYANHPSFVMLTFGNELQAKKDGMEIVHRLLRLCHDMDKTRLFAFASNAFYGEKGADDKSDFYTAMRYNGLAMRATFDGMQGYLNNEYPDAKHDYSETVAKIREDFKKPVFSFEVGQFEVLPDFKEISEFHGVTSPKNIELIRENVAKKGFLSDWEKRVEATGELSLIGYREEVEAALRTEDYSGISLLGLQDFPGQGTALVGMLGSHLKSKPYGFADPSRFKSFFTDVLPLVYLDKYTYSEDEEIVAKVKLANYSKNDVKGKLSYTLRKCKDIGSRGEYVSIFEDASEEEVVCKCGELTEVGKAKIDLTKLCLKENTELELTACVGSFINTYRIWVYVDESLIPVKPEGIYETANLDDKAKKVLEEGGTVFFAPESTKEALPNSIKSTFTTDFWSVGTFASQEGSMGLLIDDSHPLFKDYPTAFHTDYQWFMQSSQRALILPAGIKSIVTVMDSYAYLRNMGMMLEFNCLGGKIFISTMNLQNLKDYPECRALLTSVYRYISSEEFVPKQDISYEKLLEIAG